jgi:predicted O-methyltransferase YrrM
VASDSIAAKIGRRIRLIPRALTQPREVRDQLAKDFETVLDRLGKRVPRYDPVSWPQALVDLTKVYPDASAVAAEPQLQQFEAAIRERLRVLEDEGHRELVFNCDFALARCAYLVCRILRPTLVIETGVAYGLSSAFILKALSVNGSGTLHSIDLPPLGDAADHVGLLVVEDLRQRWQLHRGTSRDHLPALIDQHQVDVFLHDSLHTYRTMRWEFGVAWPGLREGGVLLSDDIQGNRAFAEVRPKATFSCAIREDQKAELFGVAVK